MTARNKLLTAPPYAVEQTLKRLGANLRTARLRRNLTIDDMAEKIGTGERAVADAEKGKPSTSIAVYAAMLWALDLLNQIADVAAPEKDDEGQTLALSRERARARPTTGTKIGLDNDF
ncbi:helix-turn-helix transcriptional regulator [Propionivibrio sp.]|uniref:helix-turn-helix transcriptional regulator n=1 Tax=Propionivibrio sp. TaxID=2212460 RepID=UPI00261EAC19|nr:helix-turn-helix transcriptional regulator [Propionivibrio sp.]